MRAGFATPDSALPWLAVLLPLGLVVDRVAPGAAVAAALAAIVVLGVPHGLSDVAQLAGMPARARGTLTSGYAVLFALALALFAWTPSVALAVFLGLSVLHFGSSDALARHGAARIAESAWRGLLPIVLPSFAFPDAVAAAFGAIVADPAAGAALAAFTGSPVCCAVVAVALCASLATAARARRGNLFAEAALLCLWFGLVQPLVAFAAYFVCVHAARHSRRHLAVAASSPLRLAATAMAQARWAAWLTLAAFAVGLAWMVRDGAWLQGALRSVFGLLFALTVPHCALAWVLARRPALQLPVASPRLAR